MIYPIKGKRIWVAGHNGMVGSALHRRLESEGCEILYVDRKELDLTHQEAVEKWIGKYKPDAIMQAAAKVGGIHANSQYPAEFIRDNLTIQTNIIHAAYINKVEKLLFLGSSCIYPKEAPQPLKEEYLLTGALEPTNEPYAIAKIAGIKMCESYRKQYGCDFVTALPCNLYGPNDNFHPKNSHVIAALMRRFYEAKENKDEEVIIWGTGNPLREFIHVDDLADACIHIFKNYSSDKPINIGTGEEVSIKELAKLIASIIGFKGQIIFDPSKPDGAMRKVLDVSRVKKLGWRPRVKLKDGLEEMLASYTSKSSIAA